MAKVKNMKKIHLETIQRPLVQDYHLHIRISSEEHARAKEVAEANNISVSELVRMLLTKV